MKNPKMSNAEMEALFEKALQAGRAAGNAAKPSVMIVSQHANMADDNSPVKKQWIVPDGPCGFAWIKVRPGNSRFASWLKKNDLGNSDSYAGGVIIWVSEYNQSMQRKEAHASAMAKVLREAGIKAHSESRMD